MTWGLFGSQPKLGVPQWVRWFFVGCQSCGLPDLLFIWSTCHRLRFCPQYAKRVVLWFLATLCLCLVVAKFNQMCGLFTNPNSSTTFSLTGLTLFRLSVMMPFFQISFWGYKGSYFRWICSAAGENPQVKKVAISCPYLFQCCEMGLDTLTFLGVIHERLYCCNMEYWTRLWGESMKL
jgi:hypothetical protein